MPADRPLRPVARTLARLSGLTGLVALIGGGVFFGAGCADRVFVEEAPAADVQAAPFSSEHAKLRHPALLDSARTVAPGKSGASEVVHVYVAFEHYEADGITRRVLDEYGITRRILDEYGITRRVLDEYGITRRVLDEYGITRRVLDEYGGLTMELLEAYGITRRILDDYGVTRDELAAQIADFERVVRLRLRVSKARPGITVAISAPFFDAVLADLAADPDVELAEPDVPLRGRPLYAGNGMKAADELVSWALQDVGGVFTSFNPDPVHVYVLDSGVYERDLNLVEQKDFTMLFKNREVAHLDEAEIERLAFFDPGSAGNPLDESGHGAHVAGIIGARANNEGVRGVAPDAKLHSLKVLTAEGQTDLTTVLAAVDYVTRRKQQQPSVPTVLNLSLGMDLGTTAYNVLDEAVAQAVAQGVVVVVSAGNDGRDASTYSPAHVEEAITVGAYDRTGRFAAFSNHGPLVDLLAPGDVVPSMSHLKAEYETGEFVLMSGTSHAAPHVAGAAALYLARHPEATPAEVEAALVAHARAGITGLPPGTTGRSVYVDGFAGDGKTQAFRFDRARWDGGNRELRVEGVGPRLEDVALVDVVSGDTLGATTITEEGRWHGRFVLDRAAPCRVEARAGGQRYALGVDEADGTCVPFKLTKAEWSAPELRVEGQVTPAGRVEVVSAATGAFLFGGRADDRGTLVLRVQDPAFVPCAVTVRSADDAALTATLTVAGAPTTCSAW